MSHRTFDFDKKALCFRLWPVVADGTNSAFMALSVAFIPIRSRADGIRTSAAAADTAREMARSDKETCSHSAQFFFFSLPPSLRLPELNPLAKQPAVTECAECRRVVTHSFIGR